MNRSLELRAFAAPWWRGIQFLIEDLSSGKRAVGVNIEMQTLEDPGTFADPTFTLDMAQAQTLMDDLWNCGIRPTEGTGSAGSLKATQKHLDDMRRLVFEQVPERTEIQPGD